MPEILPTDVPGHSEDREDKISRVAEATLEQIPTPEIEPYNISFSDYKEDKCSVNGMNGNNAQMAIKIVKDIGLNFKNQEHFSRQVGSKIEIKPVINSSPYDDYYKKLPSEIVDAQEVKEIKYVNTRSGKEADLRIFYYTLSNIFYMLAITANIHENLDHKEFKFKKNNYRR